MNDLESTVERVIVHFNPSDALTQDTAEELLKSFEDTTYNTVHEDFEWDAEPLIERKMARTYSVEVATEKQADFLADYLVKNHRDVVADAYRDAGITL